jgi:UDP-N-acetylmuramoyl-L-alanyl-D-glutamate--2,6-diaminopimelate ligase
LQFIDFINTDKNLPVSGVTSDSRQVRKNYLFAALTGTKMDGSQFIEDAIHHGASVILADEGVALPESAPDHVQIVNDVNPRQVFAKIAAKFYKIQPENIVAVTGTSGKTSTVSFVQQIWHLSGLTKCASLGTLGLRGPGMRRYGSLTTPDTQNLHAELADLASVGINHLAMEASSHGLDQYRLDGVKIRAAAYTNLSRDHLDYHKGMDNYFIAKSRLFSELLEDGGVAVINADDEYTDKLAEICKVNNHDVMSFGYAGEAIKLISRVAKPDGQDIQLNVGGHVYDITLPLVGEFQVMNALCALGLVLTQDNDPEKYIPTLEKLRGVPGRLQLVSDHPKGAVYVDYAHKPAALEAVLKTLRPHTANNLVCVFGCGGNRDAGKRALMGKIANELADKVIVTDDNPRHENPAEIRAQILDAVPKAIEIGDRSQAIHRAVEELQEGDVLVVAGKGHERGQIVAETVYAFDDVEEVKKSIEKVS